MELSAAQIGDFERDGFLVARGVVDNATIAAVRRDFFVRVQYLSGIYGLPLLEDFDEAVTQLICRAPEAYQHMDISLPMSSEMAAMAAEWRRLFGDQWRQESGVFVGDAIFRLISHPNIISIARRLLGPEVECSPVQHTRIKPPQHLLPDVAAGDANMSRTLWHQDEAVVHEGARGAEILTVWLAMTDATPENGCMFAVSGSHLEPDSDNTADFGLTTHCPGKRYVAEIYIPENAIDRARLSPLVCASGRCGVVASADDTWGRARILRRRFVGVLICVINRRGRRAVASVFRPFWWQVNLVRKIAYRRRNIVGGGCRCAMTSLAAKRRRYLTSGGTNIKERIYALRDFGCDGWRK